MTAQRTRKRLGAAFVLAVLLSTCGRDSGAGDIGDGESGDTSLDHASSALRIGSFDFPESELLAELYAQALEAAGLDVVRLGAVGSREIVAPALEQGQIDLVPEYLATATTYFSAGNIDLVVATASGLRALLEPRGLVALAAAPAENTNVFVVLVNSGLGPRISDLSGPAQGLRFGGLTECRDRSLCFAGLQDRYGLQFEEFVVQPSLPITAEALRRGEIDVGLMFSTDAALTEEFLVLDDDLALQAADNIVPIIRADALRRGGGETELTATINAVSAVLTTQDLGALNRRVAAGADISVVAGEWLEQRGLLG